MNHTKNPQAANTMQRIVDQAIRLFLEKGYYGTSIDEITQAAGVTKGALYWHFKSKKDLLKKIVEKFEKRFLDGLIQVVGEMEGGALDKFEKYLRYMSAFAYYNRELCLAFTTLATELLGADPRHEIEGDIRRVYRKYYKFVSGLIDSGKKARNFKREIDSALAALVIVALHDGLLFHWSMNRDKIAGEAYVRTFRDIILDGLLVNQDKF